MAKMTENHAKSRLFYLTRSYPTFGRGKVLFDPANPPKTVTDSPYYWWYMFLKLNNDYQKTCKTKGRGKFADLYKDFGNVNEVNFKQWWQERPHLFAEPAKNYKMTIAKQQSELAPFDSEEVLNLVVPLNWSHRSLKKYFSQLVLSKVPKSKRGVSVDKSEAKYKLSGKWHIGAMATAHKIYTIKQRCLAEGVKMTWADIAIEAEMRMALLINKKGNKNWNSDVRRRLTILAQRHYARAESYINAAATEYFPYGKK